MAEAAPKPSDSMEDILQSIKRIIEDDSATEAKPAEDAGDVLDLTEVIQDDGSIASLPPLPSHHSASPQPAAASTPEPAPIAAEPSPAELSIPAEKPTPKPLTMEEGLVSDQAAQAAAAALKPITESGNKDFSLPHIPSSPLRNGSTVEDLILEALKPMLKAWLDEHLPTIVQKIVEKEVKRIVTFHQG